MSEYIELPRKEFLDNPLVRIGDDWMLVTAGTEETGCNTLTACWGGIGDLWHRDAAFIFIRPTRYTYEFIEKNEMFSLTFFPKKGYRKALSLLGTKSGRDGDKITEAGLHVEYLDGVPTFEEGNLVLLCKKMYYLDFVPERIPKDVIDRFYPDGDFHRFYAGEIVKIYHKK
jgi:flavin reductase (DIM6/NTAB) family NADH-FMN oxidoreductase RutF